MKANPNCITITTSAADNLVKIAIADNGLGVADTTLTRLFDPFFTTKDVGKGSGLGLSIAQNLS
ncbi:hypothetical protein CK516_06490 [Nostoc sp. 'Peltigera malacea cyanobiont' DB3992]|nr:hypothetical protein CK516_06490 [Nostoc sp. 'Peltigera malacea cyanobiont' DB3992]